MATLNATLRDSALHDGMVHARNNYTVGDARSVTVGMHRHIARHHNKHIAAAYVFAYLFAYAEMLVAPETTRDELRDKYDALLFDMAYRERDNGPCHCATCNIGAYCDNA